MRYDERKLCGVIKMAKRIGLSIYGLSVLGKEGGRELHNISQGQSFLDIFQEFAEKNKGKLTTDPKKESVFVFEKIERETIKKGEQIEVDILYGRVKTGEYGIESELVNIKSGKVDNRTPEQADLLPFGFCIAVPGGQVEKGVVLLQNIGNFGMKIALQKRMQKCFSEMKENISVIWGQILPKAYLDKYFDQGVLQKIRMIRYEIPEDISERIGINYGVKQTREERVIHKPIGFLERKQRELAEWRTGQRSCTKIIEIEDYEYDDLKLEFELGSSTKVISLKDTTGLKVTEDITKKVQINRGIPEFDSLKSILKESARGYLAEMGLIEK